MEGPYSDSHSGHSQAVVSPAAAARTRKDFMVRGWASRETNDQTADN